MAYCPIKLVPYVVVSSSTSSREKAKRRGIVVHNTATPIPRSNPWKTMPSKGPIVIFVDPMPRIYENFVTDV